MILETIALIVVSIVFLLGVILTALGLPGTFAVFAGAILYNLITWSWAISLKILLVILGVSVLAEIIEFVFSAWGSKRLKLSNKAMIGMIIGSIIGGIIGFPVFLIGSVIGVMVGAFIGAFVFSYFEQRSFRKALKAGIGGFITRIGVIVMKFILALLMIVIFFLELFL